MAFIQLDRSSLESYLSRLTADRTPEWGTMSPQFMIEHLIRALRIGRGEEKWEVEVPSERLEKMRDFLYTDRPFPQGVNSVTVQASEDLWYDDLDKAKEAFLEEWDEFQKAFEEEPDKMETHPVFGELDRQGWEQVHRKHFTHHFQQFGLLDEA
jgi:oxepin-CoA hydrolase/3-oxo-5,6-dehydrosuberyl-CoA semialdehyde dehydrogenase